MNNIIIEGPVNDLIFTGDDDKMENGLQSSDQDRETFRFIQGRPTVRVKHDA